MNIRGIDTANLGDQFFGFVEGKVLILDGDGPAYAAAATSKTLPTAIRKFQQHLLTQMFLTKAQFVRVHLTAETSHKAGRYNILAAKPYQGNRQGKEKPPLLESLRQGVVRRENWIPEYDAATMHYILEADDGMMQDAYLLKENGIMWSADKDLRMTPYPYYDQDTGKIVTPQGFGSLHLKLTNDGSKKCLGYGRKFFWAQMLMGDTADNIKGLLKLDGKLCGPASAYDYLNPLDDESAGANAVVDAYRAINQNPLPEGWLLWLLRWDGDTFWNYCNELDWTPANRKFLDDCATRVWFRAPAKEEELDDVPF